MQWSGVGQRADSDTSAAWEPFVIVRRVEADGEQQPPRFSEGFIGRYRNKVEFITHLRAKRFKFFTLLREFVVHVPHNVSDAMDPNMQLLKTEMIQLHVGQTSRLLKKYVVIFVVPSHCHVSSHTHNTPSCCTAHTAAPHVNQPALTVHHATPHRIQVSDH